MTFLGKLELFDEQLQGVRPVGDIEPIIQFTVRGDPVPQGSMVAFVSRTTHRAMMKPGNERSLKAWRSACTHAAQTAMGERAILRGPIGLIVTFVMSRPRSHYGVKGLLASAPAYPTTHPDLSKLQRAVEDSMTGIVYVDDSQVVTRAERKIYGETPGVRVGVTHPSDALLSFEWEV